MKHRRISRIFLMLGVFLAMGSQARGGDAPAGRMSELLAEDERLRAALEDWELKRDDPEAFYRRIEAILSRGTADPNLLVSARGREVKEPDPRWPAPMEYNSYLTESLSHVHYDYRLANMLLRHGANAQAQLNDRASALESTIITCNVLSLALLRLNGVELTRTERYLLLPLATRASNQLTSMLGGDSARHCEATRAVAVMPLDELVSWLHYPTPYDSEIFLMLYADGVFDELTNAQGYGAALVAAQKAGRSLPSLEGAWIRAGIDEGHRSSWVPQGPRWDERGDKESMAPARRTAPPSGGSEGGRGAGARSADP